MIQNGIMFAKGNQSDISECNSMHTLLAKRGFYPYHVYHMECFVNTCHSSFTMVTLAPLALTWNNEVGVDSQVVYSCQLIATIQLL